MIPSARNPEFEALIEAEPDDTDRYLVYSDWLQARGDRRGELITIQIARAALTGDLDKKQQKRLAELTEAEQRALKPFQDEVTREFASVLAKEEKPEWRNGFLQRVTLLLGSFHPAAAKEIERLLSHPAARFVRTVSLRATSQQANLTWALDLCAQLGRPSCLSRVAIDERVPPAEVNFSAMGATFPRLKALVAVGGKVTFEGATFPALEALTLGTLKAEWSGAPWPGVRALSLHPQLWGRRPLPAWVRDLLLGPRRLRQLRELTSRHSHGEELGAALSESDLLEQMTWLDFTNAANNQVARRLLDNAGRMPKLERLYLGSLPDSWQKVDDATRAELKRVFGERVRFNLPASLFDTVNPA